MLLFFAGGLVGVGKHLFQRVSLITSTTLPLNYIFVLLLANVDVIPKQKQLSTVHWKSLTKERQRGTMVFHLKS